MITKQDIILLLTELKNNGEDIDSDIDLVIKSPAIPLTVIKKINDFRLLELSEFYKKIKTSYNKKHSKLYINIMKADEGALKDPNLALTTLSGLLNQILQFKCEDKVMFLKHARFEEILEVLAIYSKTFNINPILKLLHLIKCDIKTMEYLQTK